MGGAAVGLDDDAGEPKASGLDPRQRADRRPARSVERGQERPLGGKRGPGFAIADRGKHGTGSRVAGPGGDGDGALPGRRRPRVGIDQAGDPARQAEPRQTCGAEQDRIGTAVVQPGDAGADVAAQAHHLQIGTGAQGERRSPERRGADRGPGCKVAEPLRRGCDEGVARVAALQAGGDDRTFGEPCLHVLGRMHRRVDAPVAQRLVEFPGEQALAAGLGDRPLAESVAGGADRHDGDRRGRQHAGGDERPADLLRLGESQRTSAGSKANLGGLHEGLSGC
jgi:hypothetical protein